MPVRRGRAARLGLDVRTAEWRPLHYEVAPGRICGATRHSVDQLLVPDGEDRIARGEAGEEHEALGWIMAGPERQFVDVAGRAGCCARTAWNSVVRRCGMTFGSASAPMNDSAPEAARYTAGASV